MPIIQRIFFSFIALAIFILIVELVRRRYLRDYHSIIWLTTSIMLFFFIYNYSLLLRVSAILQVTPSIILLFLGNIFLLLLVLQLSILNSIQAGQIKNLMQYVALVNAQDKRSA